LRGVSEAVAALVVVAAFLASAAATVLLLPYIFKPQAALAAVAGSQALPTGFKTTAALLYTGGYVYAYMYNTDTAAQVVSYTITCSSQQVASNRVTLNPGQLFAAAYPSPQPPCYMVVYEEASGSSYRVTG